MTYELAKQLKEAGFPQHHGECADDIPTEGATHEQGMKGFLCVPTLSELIEACGEGLSSLSRHGNIWQTNWVDGMAGETAGNTPEEAVANLWLYLQKNGEVA